jgi:hypothetical protein
MLNDPPQMTEAQAEARALAKDVPASATNVQIVEPSAIPTDRSFRNAWEQSGAAIVHSMAKCRALWRQKMREHRAERWPVWDAAYLQADEQGDLVRKTQLAAKRQQLRDVTAHPNIDAATTPDELKLVWPTILEEMP